MPKISKTTFWDVDVDNLDYVNNHEYIIARIFDRGTLDEVIQIIHFYGIKKTLSTLLSTERLHQSGIDLAKNIFHLKPSQFKCLENKQYPLS